jgi:hypothetical protein
MSPGGPGAALADAAAPNPTSDEASSAKAIAGFVVQPFIFLASGAAFRRLCQADFAAVLSKALGFYRNKAKQLDNVDLRIILFQQVQ